MAKKRHSAGYSILEMSLALLFLSAVVLTSEPMLVQLKHLLSQEVYLVQDENGIYQLQIELATANIVSIDDDCIIYNTADNECQLSLVNRKLISQPGTLDFIHDISSVNFEVSDQVIYLYYYRGRKKYEYPIGYYWQ